MDEMDVELGEVQDGFFTKWVSEEKRETQRTYMPPIRYKDEALSSAVHRWLLRPHRSETRKVKVMIRQGVRPKYRPTLWRLLTGATEKLKNTHYFRDVVADLGVQIPSTLVASMFAGTGKSPNFHYLEESGEVVTFRVIFILMQYHADIQFCPLLPPLVAIFLHFMNERDCYACLSSILDSRQSLLDQSQRSVTVMAKTFQDCLKIYMKPAYRYLKDYIEASGTPVTKGTVMLPYWVQWMFDHLDFWTLVSIVDSLLLQGPKVLVRFGLVIYSQFSRWLDSKSNFKGDLENLFSQFMKEYQLKGNKLQEAAFKIRGLSRNKLTRLNNRNMELLDKGILEIPYKQEMPVREVTVMAVQGTDIITPQQWEYLSSWLPDRVRIKKPICIFSTQEDGCSIKTFYHKCQEMEETLLLIKTATGDLIGAFCASPWMDRLEGHKNLTFFGTGETFVFTLKPVIKRYVWSGLHKDSSESRDFFMAGNDDCLMIGGGRDNALWIDAELMHGRSGRSQTFNNESLTGQQDFICMRMEVLGFES